MINIKDIDFNEDLKGFVVTLEDGRIVQVQFNEETNVLHADYGSYYPIIDRQNEYGLDLTDEEEEEFIEWMKSNKEILNYANSLEEGE